MRVLNLNWALEDDKMMIGVGYNGTSKAPPTLNPGKFTKTFFTWDS